MGYEKMIKKELIAIMQHRDREIEILEEEINRFGSLAKQYSSEVDSKILLMNAAQRDLKQEMNEHTAELIQREEERKEMEEFMNRQSEQIAVAKEVMEALEKTIVRLNLEETMRRGINEN